MPLPGCVENAEPAPVDAGAPLTRMRSPTAGETPSIVVPLIWVTLPDAMVNDSVPTVMHLTGGALPVLTSGLSTPPSPLIIFHDNTPDTEMTSSVRCAAGSDKVKDVVPSENVSPV